MLTITFSCKSTKIAILVFASGINKDFTHSSEPWHSTVSMQRYVPLSEKRGQLSSYLHWSLGPQRGTTVGEERAAQLPPPLVSRSTEVCTTVREERAAQLPPPPVCRSTERYHCRRREGSSAPTSTGLSVHREVPLSEKRGQLSSHLHWSLGPQRGTTVGEERAAVGPRPSMPGRPAAPG